MAPSLTFYCIAERGELKWSKLKQMVEARLAPELRGRLAVQMTRYRRAHDDEGELWLALDGRKIYGSSYYGFVKQRSLEQDADALLPLARTSCELETSLVANGVVDHMALTKALFESLSQPLEEMLASVHPLVRAMAVSDARCGKRRLRKIDVTAEHELVAALHAQRISTP
jgi:hypothetical protein